MPRGRKPGGYGADLRGLEVRFSDLVEELGSDDRQRTGRFAEPGWFVFVRIKRGSVVVWEAVLSLRFVRQRDADLAANALRVAELDSARRMKHAGAERVIVTAYEALQW